MTRKWQIKTDSRLSRGKVEYAGTSLRGMTAREHYQMQRMKPQGIMAAIKPVLGHSLWAKYDRGRPLTHESMRQIAAAINAAVMERVTDFPFIYPWLNFRVVRHPEIRNRYQLKLIGVEYRDLESVHTINGRIYFVSKSHDTLTLKGKTGRIGFSPHAFGRFLERVPNVKEHCMKRHAPTAFQIWKEVVEKKAIQYDMLRCEIVYKKKDSPQSFKMLFGHFPLEYVDGLWVAKSFLLPEMKGTPEETKRAMRVLLNKFDIGN
jgi:hypothetical protein